MILNGHVDGRNRSLCLTGVLSGTLERLKKSAPKSEEEPTKKEKESPIKKEKKDNNDEDDDDDDDDVDGAPIIGSSGISSISNILGKIQQEVGIY